MRNEQDSVRVNKSKLPPPDRVGFPDGSGKEWKRICLQCWRLAGHAGGNNLVWCCLDSMARAKDIFKSLLESQKYPYVTAFLTWNVTFTSFRNDECV